MKISILRSKSANLLYVFLLAMFLGGCVTAKQKKLDAGMKPLEEQGLHALFSQPLEATYESVKGITSSVKYFPDGTQTISNSKLSDTGSWRIVGGEVCSKWTKIRKGFEKCFTFFKLEDGKYEAFQRDGSKDGILIVH